MAETEKKDLGDRVDLALRWLNEDEKRYMEQASSDPNVRIRARMKAYVDIKPWEALRRLIRDLWEKINEK